MPRWARPLLILRDARALSVHNAGPLQAGDDVYLFAPPRQLRLLDSVYTRPGDPEDPQVYGDFALKPETTVCEFEREYGLSLGAEPDRSLGELLTAEFRGQPVPGDRIALDQLELVVRSLAPDGAVAEVGLILEPPIRPWPALALPWTLASWFRRER